MKNELLDQKNKENFFRNKYETMPIITLGGVVITEINEDFTLLFANQTYYDIVGYSKEEHIAKFHNIGIDTIHPDQSKEAASLALEQLKKEGTFSLKAKLAHKTKEYIWAHFHGRIFCDDTGRTLLSIVIIDITEYIILAEQYEKEHNFNNLISSLTDDGFFDCDIANKTIRYSKNFADRMGVTEIVTNYPESLFDKGIITPESMPYYLERFKNKFTDEVFEEELHFIAADGTDVWYLYHYNVIHDENGVPVRAVGKMTNITEQHLKLEELTKKANKDQLTDLYNKSTTEFLIKEKLKQRQSSKDKYALFIIDIDNFKNINDRLGHLYGDIVLTELANALKPLFRNDDIVGRIGGDEFFVFIRNYKSIDVIKSKAQDICKLFCRTYKEGTISVTISSSIGIALCPEHGLEFDELYRAADTALYKAKAIGKNQYAFFDGKIVNVYKSHRTEIDNQGYIQKNFQANRVEYIFKLLYSAEKPEKSVQSVLRLLTEHFGFSRGYIFETSSDGSSTSNTFEWCIDSVTPQSDSLQSLPIELLEEVIASFNETGMYILPSLKYASCKAREILEPQDIKSMFLFGIMKEKKSVGFIGFDDCINERVPTKEEIDEICTICQILATFLLKQRTTEQELERLKFIEAIMNTMNSMSYVIDYENYNVIFENKKVVQLTGKSAIGSKCYNAFRDFDKPCSDCPMVNLSEEKSQYTTDIYNKKYNIFVRTDAFWINWSGNKKACLINCIDVTEYKKTE